MITNTIYCMDIVYCQVVLKKSFRSKKKTLNKKIKWLFQDPLKKKKKIGRADNTTAVRLDLTGF